MDLYERLSEERADLAEKWLALLLQTYPQQTQQLWMRNQDPFANPVGSSFRQAVSALLDQILDWSDAEAISEALDKIIRIRAVQDFSPSQAVSFVYQLKRLVREGYMQKAVAAGTMEQFLDFEARLDNLALMAFDVYTKCREEVYEMRVKEVKNAQHKLLLRAKMIVDNSAGPADQAG
ncbi:MAG: RsbRD N-terminal domain-containing protein [Desulfovibrionaceae bacterium]